MVFAIMISSVNWIYLSTLILSAYAVRVPVKRYDVNDPKAPGGNREHAQRILQSFHSINFPEEAPIQNYGPAAEPAPFLTPPRTNSPDYFTATETTAHSAQILSSRAPSSLVLRPNAQTKKTVYSVEQTPVSEVQQTLANELMPPIDYTYKNDINVPNSYNLPQGPNSHRANYLVDNLFVKSLKPNSLDFSPYVEMKSARQKANLHPVQQFKPIPIPVEDIKNDKQYEYNFIPKFRNVNPITKYQTIDVKDNNEHSSDEKNEKVENHPKNQNRSRCHREDWMCTNTNNSQTLMDSDVAESYKEEPEKNNIVVHDSATEENLEVPSNVFSEEQHAPKEQSSKNADGDSGGGDRTEFRVHGLQGPNSYKFGYDTGKGKNRQFRYEEKDGNGNVRGRYGYMDHTGKMTVINYDATPEGGFRAQTPASEPKEESDDMDI